MKYELAKRLKDVGFPQNSDKLEWPSKGETSEPEQLYYPNLSELIQVCEKDFDYLSRVAEGTIMGKDVWWRAYMTEEAFAKTGIDCVVDCDGYGAGDTPEEAVAEMYLLIHGE